MKKLALSLAFAVVSFGLYASDAPKPAPAPAPQECCAQGCCGGAGCCVKGPVKVESPKGAEQSGKKK